MQAVRALVTAALIKKTKTDPKLIRCTRCRTEKHRREFDPKAKKRHCTECRKQVRERNRSYAKTRTKPPDPVKAELNEIKLSIGCQHPDCKWSGSFLPTQLEFHHVDPSSKSSVVNKLRTKELRDAEIAKCVVLCRNCHAAVHALGVKSAAMTPWTHPGTGIKEEITPSDTQNQSNPAPKQSHSTISACTS